MAWETCHQASFLVVVFLFRSHRAEQGAIPTRPNLVDAPGSSVVAWVRSFSGRVLPFPYKSESIPLKATGPRREEDRLLTLDQSRLGERQDEVECMSKDLGQIRIGDLLFFAGRWHAVVSLRRGNTYGMLCFKTYPPVIVRADDKFEAQSSSPDIE
jgi:hypothetical protein